jgi:hypothetical protein
MENQNTTNNNENNPELSTPFYLVGLIIMFIGYAGPYIYYKYYKKKNFSSGGNTGVKHAI